MHVRLLLVAALVAALSGVMTAEVSASGGSFDFTYQLGTGFVSGVPPSDETAVHGPDMSIAANGDTITITGTGRITFRQAKGSNRISAAGASGEGTFAHKAANGSLVASGTWTATELLDFQSYGDGSPQSLPTNNFGGLALLRVHYLATAGPGTGSEGDALLWVDCLIGSPPADAVEGIRYAVPGAIDFNKQVSGETLLVAQAS